MLGRVLNRGGNSDTEFIALAAFILNSPVNARAAARLLERAMRSEGDARYLLELLDSLLTGQL